MPLTQTQSASAAASAACVLPIINPNPNPAAQAQIVRTINTLVAAQPATSAAPLGVPRIPAQPSGPAG
jgi:hypothetical protein